MTNINPSRQALVPFVSVDNMMKIINTIGPAKVIAEIVEYIEADFLRWELFDKTPRVAAHSEEGVIELMPTSDGETYGFKYVNGHPKNTTKGLQTVTAFGMLANVSNGYPVLLSEMTILTALRTAATSAVAARYLAPQRLPCHGNDRQWRTMRISGHRFPENYRYRHRPPLRHRPGGNRKSRAQSGRQWPNGYCLQQFSGRRGRRADRDHLHRG